MLASKALLRRKQKLLGAAAFYCGLLNFWSSVSVAHNCTPRELKIRQLSSNGLKSKLDARTFDVQRVSGDATRGGCAVLFVRPTRNARAADGLIIVTRCWSNKRMSIIWAIIIGFIAGVVAKFITPGDNKPSGFILTTLLGIVGAFVATWLGQAIGWYHAGEGAGLIGATVGAIIVLLVWGYFQTASEKKRRRI